MELGHWQPAAAEPAQGGREDWRGNTSRLAAPRKRAVCRNTAGQGLGGGKQELDGKAP